MPPSSYPAAQISASVDRNSAPSLSARAALDAYAANAHLRSSPTFEFLHFAVVTDGKVKMDDSDVNLLGLQGDYGDGIANVTTDQYGWHLIDVDLEDANGGIFPRTNRTTTLTQAASPILTLTLALASSKQNPKPNHTGAIFNHSHPASYPS